MLKTQKLYVNLPVCSVNRPIYLQVQCNLTLAVFLTLGLYPSVDCVDSSTAAKKGTDDAARSRCQKTKARECRPGDVKPGNQNVGH